MDKLSSAVINRKKRQQKLHSDVLGEISLKFWKSFPAERINGLMKKVLKNEKAREKVSLLIRTNLPGRSSRKSLPLHCFHFKTGFHYFAQYRPHRNQSYPPQGSC